MVVRRVDFAGGDHVQYRKPLLVRNSGAVEIRKWDNTPCRYGAACKAHRRGHCAFNHDDEAAVEIAAGSALRLRQIKQAFERNRTKLTMPTSSKCKFAPLGSGH